jgi:DDE superfamily endonuclease
MNMDQAHVFFSMSDGTTLEVGGSRTGSECMQELQAGLAYYYAG